MATKKIAPKQAKLPTVTVETKKITSEKDVCCSTTPCGGIKIKKFCIMFFTLLNTILLIVLLVNQSKVESLKVGGDENYKLLKQVFKTEGYQQQQKQQIEQALQMFSTPAAQQQAQGAAQQGAQQTPTANQQQAQGTAQQGVQQAPTANQQQAQTR